MRARISRVTTNCRNALSSSQRRHEPCRGSYVYHNGASPQEHAATQPQNYTVTQLPFQSNRPPQSRATHSSTHEPGSHWQHAVWLHSPRKRQPKLLATLERPPPLDTALTSRWQHFPSLCAACSTYGEIPHTKLEEHAENSDTHAAT